jgi:hypothetical protein
VQKSTSEKEKRWNVDKLKEEKGRQVYQKALTRKLQENKMGIDEEEEEEEDIDEEWRNIEKAIKESAEETTGGRKNRETRDGLMKNVLTL